MCKCYQNGTCVVQDTISLCKFFDIILGGCFAWLYRFCITISMVSFIGAVVSKLATSNKGRVSMWGLLECNMWNNLLGELTLYFLLSMTGSV